MVLKGLITHLVSLERESRGVISDFSWAGGGGGRDSLASEASLISRGVCMGGEGCKPPSINFFLF